MKQSSPHTLFRSRTALAGCLSALVFASGAVAAPKQAQTSDEASQSNLQGAILAPLRDVNLMRDDVPDVLNGAKEAPYLDPQQASCAQLATMIAPLDEALGPDTGDGAEVAGPGARGMVYGAMADVTRDFIPFRGVVRRITGAAKHDQEVQAARKAGNLRRAYLKGFASAKGCYGPPQPQQVAERGDVQSAPLPQIPPAQPAPITVATADLPVPPPPPEPRFNLPESWKTQISTAN